MPLNKTKIYNELLDIEYLRVHERMKSLRGIFDRDFERTQPYFLGKPIYPSPNKYGESDMDTLFRHLTTEKINKKTGERFFEIHRSKRLHWIKFHLDQKKKDNMLLFSIKEPDGDKTYYYDKDENYVIVLSPLRCNAYYLLTAYYVQGKDAKRNKIERKYRRRLDRIL